VTFYKGIEQLPPFDDYSMANRTYRYFAADPLYPFGFGLSYTKFRYSNPQVSSDTVNADGSITVSAVVANGGAVDSDEVVQLYLTHEGVPGAALRELRGFQRIHLAHGQSKRVDFTLRDRDLSVVDAEGKRRIVNGTVKAWLGGGQPGATGYATPGISTQFKIASEATLPD
jgi:beta-glucosidase